MYANTFGQAAQAKTEETETEEPSFEEQFIDYKAKNSYELIHRYLMHRRRLAKKRAKA